MIVMKFGGSSVAGAEKISRVAAIVKGRLKDKPVLVVSALRGVTDDLLALGPEALKDDLSRISVIEKRHKEAAKELGVDFAPLEPLFAELRELARGVELLRELTPRTIDRLASFGERLSVRLVAAAFVKAGIPARAVDAFDAGLLVDERFGAANPLPEADAAIAKAFASFKDLPVVTGFIGRTPSGQIATLGRNGSDYTATILGAALGAKEIQIWSDTDGIMTADPRIVPAAQPLSTLSFDEACELAYYGGKVLHPHTLVPAMRKDIPVRVLNTFKPEHPGTSIIAKPPKTSGPAPILKSIAFKRRQSIVSASSPKMLSGHGFLARIFATLARHELDVDMVSTSEVSVSASTAGGPGLEKAVAELSQEFDVAVETGKAVICAVGDGIQAARGVAADVFAAVSGAGVNIRMISQGASKNNIAFVVDDAEVEKTVGALHARFFK